MVSPPQLPASLETPRLLLRPVSEEDLPFFTLLHANPEVVRFLGGDGKPRPPEQTRAWLELILSWYERDRVGAYAVVERTEERLIGRCGLSLFEVEAVASSEDGVPIATWGFGSAAQGTEVERILEIGYVIHPQSQGSGYATEAAKAWVDYAFTKRGEPMVHSLIHPENVGSVRVAQKNGFVRDEIGVRMDGRDYDRYHMSQVDWVAQMIGAAIPE